MRWIVSQKIIPPPGEAIILLIDLSLYLSIKREKIKQLIYINSFHAELIAGFFAHDRRQPLDPHQYPSPGCGYAFGLTTEEYGRLGAIHASDK